MVRIWAPAPRSASLSGEAGELGDPQPGLDVEGEHGVVTSARPCVSVTSGEEGVGLGVGEVGDEVAFGPLGRDGEHPLDGSGVFGVVQGEVGDNEWMAASRLLRVATLLFRSPSRWPKNAVMSGASTSAMSRAAGVLPVRSEAKPRRSLKLVL